MRKNVLYLLLYYIKNILNSINVYNHLNAAYDAITFSVYNEKENCFLHFPLFHTIIYNVIWWVYIGKRGAGQIMCLYKNWWRRNRHDIIRSAFPTLCIGKYVQFPKFSNICVRTTISLALCMYIWNRSMWHMEYYISLLYLIVSDGMCVSSSFSNVLWIFQFSHQSVLSHR